MTPARKRWMLIAAVAAFLVAFTALENLFREEPQGTAPAEEMRGVFSPAAPEVRLPEGGGVEIRHDYFRRTTIRLDDEAAERALFECLERGIEATFGDGTEGWDRARIGGEMQRIQDECMAAQKVDLPVIPVLPLPEGR